MVRKFFNGFLLAQEFDLKLGVGVHNFQNYFMYVSFENYFRDLVISVSILVFFEVN